VSHTARRPGRRPLVHRARGAAPRWTAAPSPQRFGRACRAAARVAQQHLGRPAEEGRRHLVELLHALAERVEQRDGQRRGLDDALQRGLRLRDADLGLAPALDVQQREGELAAAAAPRPGEHRVAHDPELAPVARLQPALEGLGLAFVPARSQSVRRSGWSGSGVATVLMGSPTKSASSPANMRRAERFIHSMPPSPR
jgi:hypothetical protein